MSRRAIPGFSAVVLLILAMAIGRQSVADEPADAYARRVTELADRWVAEVKARFPITYMASGLPTDKHDKFDENAPEDVQAWREFVNVIEAELARIAAGPLANRPEWVTWHYLRQGLAQERANTLCRSELWQVSPLGWQSHLSQLTDLQPVNSGELRAQALARWRQFPLWVDREIANLKEGLRLGYSATKPTVTATLVQLDTLLATWMAQSPLMSPTARAGTAEFQSAWRHLIETDIWPALRRYRDFLRDEYLPHARTSVSLSINTNGSACYRALIFANSTVDEEPRTLFEMAMRRHRDERALALDLGRKLYGEKAKDWNALAALIRADPRAKFARRDDITAYVEKTVAQAMAAQAKIVREPPDLRLKTEPVPEYRQTSGPSGEYVRGADDGTRPGVFYYRNLPRSVSRASLQSLIFHETVPGHHLQAAVLAQRQRKVLHPVTRLIWCSGPSEGWASYASDFAREIALYDSNFEIIGHLMSSVTPPMVADLGMQVMGWSADQAIAYLNESMPLRPADQTASLMGMITGSPAAAISYPLGAMQFEQMRRVAETRLGENFDVREFHEVVLSDGMLPFDALRVKVTRWVEQTVR